MPILNDIQFILHRDFEAPNQNRFIETHPDFVQEITITSNSCSFKSYKYDKTLPKHPGGLFPFFAQNPGVQKVSDYILFVERGPQFYVLIVELKRGKSSTIAQLQASKCFVNYVIKTVNRVQNTHLEPQIRLISISARKREKRPTKEKPVQYDVNDHTEFNKGIFSLRSFLL